MKYLSIDIETTGLDPEKCDILEVAAIIEDTEKKLPREECPTFHCYIDREYYNCDPFTCEMNFKIFKEINKLKGGEGEEENLIQEENFGDMFEDFIFSNLDDTKGFTLAGANLEGFDMKFLYKKLSEETISRFNRRAIEPAHFFVDWKTDEKLPSLQECKVRAGIAGDVAHNALDDAWDVIQVLRTQY